MSGSRMPIESPKVPIADINQQFVIDGIVALGRNDRGKPPPVPIGEVGTRTIACSQQPRENLSLDNAGN